MPQELTEPDPSPVDIVDSFGNEIRRITLEERRRRKNLPFLTEGLRTDEDDGYPSHNTAEGIPKELRRLIDEAWHNLPAVVAPSFPPMEIRRVTTGRWSSTIDERAATAFTNGMNRIVTRRKKKTKTQGVNDADPASTTAPPFVDLT